MRKEKSERTCSFVLSADDYGTWQCSECGCEWIFVEDGPEENGMRYCPGCGARIATIKIRAFDCTGSGWHDTEWSYGGRENVETSGCVRGQLSKD